MPAAFGKEVAPPTEARRRMYGLCAFAASAAELAAVLTECISDSQKSLPHLRLCRYSGKDRWTPRFLCRPPGSAGAPAAHFNRLYRKRSGPPGPYQSGCHCRSPSERAVSRRSCSALAHLPGCTLWPTWTENPGFDSRPETGGRGNPVSGLRVTTSPCRRRVRLFHGGPQALLPTIPDEKRCRDCRISQDGEVFFLSSDWRTPAGVPGIQP